MELGKMRVEEKQEREQAWGGPAKQLREPLTYIGH
jgi:hypothetical protein